MGARNAKKRHFQVEALEERLALDGTITTTMAYRVTVTDSSPGFSISTTGSENPNVTYTVSGGSSTSVTVESSPGQVAALDLALSAADGISLPILSSADEISLYEISPDEISPLIL